MQADIDVVVKQVHQLYDHDRRQPPDLVHAKTVARHIPAAALVIDTVGMLARVLAKELQRHAEYRRDLGIIGQILNVIRHQPDIRGYSNPVQRDQRAERADHLDQTRRQADLFFGLTQSDKRS